GNQEGPARNAVTVVETSVAEVREDAAKLAPEELRAVDVKLTALKEGVEKKHYKSVLSGASELTKEVAFLKETVISKKTQNAAATNEWEDLSEQVPQLISAIQNRVDSLSGSRKLPAEVNKDTFEAAKSAFESMRASWAEANAAFNAGKATEAADKGRLVKAKGEELQQQLAMPMA
ncbi:MAG TPA: hypothetical protein VD867_14845, partial [Burkholderiales bacterium]|nr:hypothetical protein [Burkholderiales bacterium]